jgi:hypothetical protein
MLSFNPIEIGFASYLDHPADIPELAHRCAGLVGATFSGSWLPLLSNADRWVAEWRFWSRTEEQLYEDSEKICMLCALAGEAIREGLDIPLAWTVRINRSMYGASYSADLVAEDGRICEVSDFLCGQLIDPDHSPRSEIVTTVVWLKTQHPFL